MPGPWHARIRSSRWDENPGGFPLALMNLVRMAFRSGFRLAAIVGTLILVHASAMVRRLCDLAQLSIHAGMNALRRKLGLAGFRSRWLALFCIALTLSFGASAAVS